MAPYQPYIPQINFADVEKWDEHVLHGLSLSAMGLGEAETQLQMIRLLHNAHKTTTATLKNYVIQHVEEVTGWMNDAFAVSYNNNDALEAQMDTLEIEIISLRRLVDVQADLLRAYKAQLDKIPADVGSGSFRQPKVPELPTFSDSDNKMSLEEWINRIILYCSTSGVVTDHHKIVCALTQLWSPATTYMRKYFDDNPQGRDLGLWKDFVGELSAIYGRHDDKEGAKEEIMLLWTNKSLASKDFIKYAEQY